MIFLNSVDDLFELCKRRGKHNHAEYSRKKLKRQSHTYVMAMLIFPEMPEMCIASCSTVWKDGGCCSGLSACLVFLTVHP
jgi:hypothetical protein